MGKTWLLAFALSITGCATVDVPEVGSDLRDYQAQAPADVAAIALDQAPQAQVGDIEGEAAACFAGPNLTRLEQFVEAARANRNALQHLVRAYHAQHAELVAILAAGRAAEEQAEVYRALYVAEAQHAAWTRVGAAGAGGLMLLILTAAAL